MTSVLRTLALLPLAVPAQDAAESRPRLEWISTEHVGRLTGTPRNPIASVGLAGTDLGVSFESQGKLVFLFGDSWTIDKNDWDVDSVALAKPAAPARGELPLLECVTRASGRFLGLAPKGLRLGGMEVPVEGLAIGARSYVFFDGGWDKAQGRHARSILAHAEGLDFASLALDHDVASEKFLNVSAVADDATLWIFGTGSYRKSGVYLARVAAAELPDRTAWRYAPDFAAGEEHAQPVVVAGDLGELSVRRIGSSKLWFMAANGAQPRGIQLRVAAQPAGPWSEPLAIFDPERDRGYGHFMHRSTRAAGFDDGLSERGREDEWGGEYGPYLVPRWSSTVAPGVHELVYTLSSWNPYQVHLMRTRVRESGARDAPAAIPKLHAASSKELQNPRFENGSLEHWTAEGDAFTTARGADGVSELSTFVEPKRDSVRGKLWQGFCVPLDARELRCVLRGGTESVRLTREGEILRESRGPRSNDVTREVRWSIDEYRGQVLHVEIVDESTAPWGFVTVRGLELVR